jgi:[ribosomal protein S18]-alanine N-acetyltransferase
MLKIERLCPTAAHWSEQQYKDLFRTNEGEPGRFALVLDDLAAGLERSFDTAASHCVGFLVGRRLHPDWELENIVVSPTFRRKGLATELLTALLTRAGETNSESVFLEVRESNYAARALYARLGFAESGRRRLYYANPADDAVLYRLRLAHPST